MPLSLSPFDGRYTRQQVSEATDLEVDVLSYWIKEGLLKAAEGEGLGRGKHRLFGFEAIHIAAVLKELGRYGVQVGGLRQVSELLWGVVAFCSDHADITEDVRADASLLRRARARYSDKASLSTDARSPDDSFESFEDWLEDHPNISAKALEIEPWFDEGADLAFALYADLFTGSIFESFDTRWIFAHADDQLIAVPEDLHLESLDLDRVRSYLMINLSLIIRPIWML